MVASKPEKAAGDSRMATWTAWCRRLRT